MLDDGGGGLTWRERDDEHVVRPTRALRARRRWCRRVVAAFHEHIRAQELDELERRVLVEDDDGVDHLERGERRTRARPRCARGASGL